MTYDTHDLWHDMAVDALLKNQRILQKKTEQDEKMFRFIHVPPPHPPVFACGFQGRDVAQSVER